MFRLMVLNTDVLWDKSSKKNSSRTFFVPELAGSQKSHFFSGIIKDGLGQKVVDGGERGRKEQLCVK